jgi:acetyl-CoA synthetase
MSEAIRVLLDEQREYAPPEGFRDRARVRDEAIYAEASRDPEAFWAKEAESLAWRRRWDRVLEWKLPFAKWFVGGRLNLSENCLDRHLATRRDKPAIVWEGEPGDERTLTYGELHAEVCRFANALAALGVRRGDRVTIYMGMTPEVAVAMLACARLGAAHSVVFGGFSATALRERIADSGSKVLITADGGWRRGGVVPLKKNADEALAGETTIRKVVVHRRIGSASGATMVPGRDVWWDDAVRGQPAQREPEAMDVEDLLFLLYTSGTTGKPKGIVHTTAGYLLGVTTTFRWVFDARDDDVHWCTADVGWVTGHSYVLYGPLSNGATTVMYEGAPDFPGRDRFWDLIARRRVTILYTAPTAIRTFMRWGTEHPDRHDLSSLRLLGSVGEPINPEAWVWYHRTIGRGRCPVVDTWWQTETGMILISPLPGVTTCRPGSACRPLPGIEADVVDDQGKSVPLGGGGYLVLRRPWPAMTRGIHGDPDRFVKTYWSKFPGLYFTGDGCKRDADGYYWLLGRVDDIMLVAGHNISTTEVESALVDHGEVAEAAVVGRTHEIKGQAVAAFVTLKQGFEPTDARREAIRAHVVRKIGSIGRPEEIHFAAELPKTRSGKIMRRLLRDIAEGRALGDTTTLADPGVVQALRTAYEENEPA